MHPDLLQVGHWAALDFWKSALSANASRAAQRPTVPSTEISTTALTTGGRGRGTIFCSIASLMAGCSIKSHISTTRLTTLSARAGLVSITVASDGRVPPLQPALDRALLSGLGVIASLVAAEPHGAGISTSTPLAQHRPIPEQSRHHLHDIEAVDVAGR